MGLDGLHVSLVVSCVAYALSFVAEVDAFSSARNESGQDLESSSFSNLSFSEYGGYYSQNPVIDEPTIEFLDGKGIKMYVPKSDSDGLLSSLPSGETDESNMYQHFGCKNCESPVDFLDYKNEESPQTNHNGSSQELGIGGDLEQSTTQSYTKRQNEMQSCRKSVSLLNDKDMCVGDVFTLKEMEPEQYIGIDPEGAFTVFNWDSLYKSKGATACQPTTLEETFGLYSVNNNITLKNCTAENKEMCHYSPASYLIAPPVIGCRMTSKTQLTFQYGTLEVKARLPAGDWVVSEITLEPATQGQIVYGNRSGRIVVARTRGNSQLRTDGGTDYSNRVLEAGVELADGPYMLRKVLKNPWSDGFHIFKLLWTPDKLEFMVDDEEIGRIRPPRGGLDPILGGSEFAPFDESFYLQVGVHAGGNRDFPDNIKGKPWNNFEPKNKLKFWLARDQWLPTWKKKDSELLLESSVLTALNEEI